MDTCLLSNNKEPRVAAFAEAVGGSRYIYKGGKPGRRGYLRAMEKMGVEKAAPLSVDFAVGDTVQITAGPLEGFMGLVEEIDTESFKVKLKVNMFGRETPAEVEIGQVELP